MYRQGPIQRVFTITLTLLILSACGTRPTPDPDPESVPTRPPTRVAPQPTPSPTAPAAATSTPIIKTLGVDPTDMQGTTVTFWHVWSYRAGETLQGLVDAFNAANEYGIRVDLLNQGGYADLSRNLIEAVNTAELPDLVVGFSNQILSWDGDAGLIADLDEYVTDPEWGYTAEERADFYSLFWGQDVVAGKRLGLPAQRSAQFLFYNTSWARELGFEVPPTTPEEFEEQACAAAESLLRDEDTRNDGTGGWVVDTSTASVSGWIHAFGGQIENEAGYNFSGEEIRSAFQFMKRLYDQGCAWRSKNRFPDPDFANRRALFTSSGTAGLPFQEESLQGADNPDEWTILPFPSTEGMPAIEFAGPSFAMIGSTPERQLATWLLIRWLLEPENQAAWIRVSGHWPSRESVLAHLEDYRMSHPQWASVEALLPYSRLEPSRASWGTVRWALSDAAEQLFRLNLSLEQIPTLLDQLDETAAELHAQSR